MKKVEELWEELLTKNPSNYDLRFIVEYIEPLHIEAGKKLLSQKPSSDDLRSVIKDCPEPLRTEAGRKLLIQNPSDWDLRYITIWVSSLKEEAQKILDERKKLGRSSEDVMNDIKKFL